MNVDSHVIGVNAMWEGGLELPPINDYLKEYSRASLPFPRQATLLKIIFLEEDQFTDYDHFVIEQWIESTKNGGDVIIPVDIYDRIKWCKDNGYPHFRQIVACVGRRAGKGYIGSKIAEYKIAQFIAMGSPPKYFGYEEHTVAYVDVLALKYSQAQAILYTAIQGAIMSDDFLRDYVFSNNSATIKIQTPYDLARTAIEKETRKSKAQFTPATICVEPNSTNAGGIRGRASFLQCFDEFALGLEGMGADELSSSSVYDAATPSLSQFGKWGMIYIPSSPWSEVGKFGDLYKQALAVDESGAPVAPMDFAIKCPSWSLYSDWEYHPERTSVPIRPPEEDPVLRAKELQNPDKFAVEYRANFAKVQDAFFSQELVDRLFNPYPSEEQNLNVLQTMGKYNLRYYAHADAGRSHDNFAFALGHRIAIDGFYHVFIDVMKVWQPSDFEPDEDGIRHIDFTVVVDEMKDIFKKFFTMKLTMDQWNSAYIIDEIRKTIMQGKLKNKAMGVGVYKRKPQGKVATYQDTISNNLARWQNFKTACYQNWVHIPDYIIPQPGYGKVNVPREELKLMVLNGNKVEIAEEKNIGGHGDLAECLSIVVNELLGDQLAALDSGHIGIIAPSAQGGYDIDATIWKQQQMTSESFWKDSGYSRMHP